MREEEKKEDEEKEERMIQDELNVYQVFLCFSFPSLASRFPFYSFLFFRQESS